MEGRGDKMEGNVTEKRVKRGQKMAGGGDRKDVGKVIELREKR